MDIQKLDYMKSFEDDLKTVYAVDKKYLPMFKKMAAVLHEIAPFIDLTEKKLQNFKEVFVQNTVTIYKTYADNLETYQKSLKQVIDQNQEAIDRHRKESVHLTHEINQHLKNTLETIEYKASDLESQKKEKIEKAEQTLKRELSQINKVISEARKTYQKVSSQIEQEKILAEVSIRRAYDLKIEDFEAKRLQLDIAFQEKIELIQVKNQDQSKINDDSYLTIKNTYTQLSISLNKKINELKKKHQNALKTLEKSYLQKVKPVEQSIQSLKKAYHEMQHQALENYQQKLVELNDLFDEQKKVYEQKKERIIHEGNEGITLLNSKLSAYRESTQREKLSTSRMLRDEMKSIETEHEKERKTRLLTAELNKFDAELNKQILRTNKDIFEKKRDTQRRLFQLDDHHLREVTHWRLQKLLYEYEKKQEYAKIDLNYNHNMNQTEAHKKLIDYEYASNQDILRYEHNKEMLPLEYQLQIASAIQERELNLLANDAHLSIASFKHEEFSHKIELEKNKSKIDFEETKAKALFTADMQVLSTNTQLELEKEKIKRDFTIQEQELRMELSKTIYEKTKKSFEDTYEKSSLDQNLEKEHSYINHKFKLDAVKAHALLEEQKNEFIINESRYKHQHRLSNEKAERLLKTYQNELEYNQGQTECFMDIHRHMHQSLDHLKMLTIELYHMPAHPEVFKGILGVMIAYLPQLLSSLSEVFEMYQSLNQEIYTHKIEDLTGYKYMLKHENAMNFYGQEIGKIKEKIKTIDGELKTLESEFIRLQTELEKHHQFIIQLGKISVDIKNNQLKSNHKHQEIKENQKLVSNHDHEIKRIKQQLARIEKQIDEKHLELEPLNKEIDVLHHKQDIAEKDLETKKRKEAQIYYAFLKKNQRIYHHVQTYVKNYFDHTTTFYEKLKDEVYVTDTILLQLIKQVDKAHLKFELQLNHTHQRFLNLMYQFYRNNEKEQNILQTGFKRSTSSLLKSLHSGYHLSLKKAEQASVKREQDRERLLKNEFDKTKKKLELQEMSVQKTKLLDQALLKSLETQISENGDKKLNELKLLNQNQVAIATQYQNEHLNRMQHMLDQVKKQLQNFDFNLANEIKNMELLKTNLETKSQSILTKYQANYEKYLNALKSKTNHFNEETSKALTHQKEKQNDYELNLKLMEKKRTNELKNIYEHLRRFQFRTKADQNKLLSKDLRLLRKTHRSKVKMLHLN